MYRKKTYSFIRGILSMFRRSYILLSNQNVLLLLHHLSGLGNNVTHSDAAIELLVLLYRI